MKKFVAAVMIFLIFLGAASWAKASGQATEKSDEELLKETVLLSWTVKEFEKTLGIEPSEALSQSTLEKPASSLTWIWIQETGATALTKPFRAVVYIKFSVPKERVPIDWINIGSSASLSYYFRQENIFSHPAAVITIDFAKMPLSQKVDIIIHEDLHLNDFAGAGQDALVTPLADIAAVKYFEAAGDVQNIKEAHTMIARRQGVSKELTALAKEVEKIFSDPNLSDDEKRQKALDLIFTYPEYAAMFKYQTQDQSAQDALEAKISHDLGYYGCYDWVLRHYEETGNFKALFEEIKKMTAMSLTELLAWCSNEPANAKKTSCNTGRFLFFVFMLKCYPYICREQKSWPLSARLRTKKKLCGRF